MSSPQNMTITVCAAMRFAERIYQLCDALEDAGFTVNRPVEDISAGLEVVVREHFSFIDESDICLFANYDGYMGNNTTVELGYAAARDVLIVGLVPDPDEGRRVLYDEILNTAAPNEVVRHLAALVRSSDT